jgi:anti-sigma factor RsiW
MNCEEYNERLPEYLDETLPAAEQAAAREHVQKCGACRQAAARQEAFGKFIRLSFHRETQGLSLSPKSRQNILDALQHEETQPLRAFFAVVWRKPVWAGLAFLCLSLFIFGSYINRQAISREADATYVVDVPMGTETYFYRRQNNRVVDAVVTGVLDANFSGNFTQN